MVPAPSSAGSARRPEDSPADAVDASAAPDSEGILDLGVQGADRLISVDGVVQRVPDGAGAAMDPALAVALAAMTGSGFRRNAGAAVGADRPAPQSPPAGRPPAAPVPRLPVLPPSPPATAVTVPVPPRPLPDFRAIAGVAPGYPPPFLFQLWLAMRSSSTDVMRLRDTWVAMGGSADLWDQWTWPLAPLDEWADPAAHGR